MSTMLNTIEEVAEVEWVLSALDRCDSCSARAMVRVTGLSGELQFCNHHYSKIMENPAGYESMMKFAITVLDERNRLIENKQKDL